MPKKSVALYTGVHPLRLRRKPYYIIIGISNVVGEVIDLVFNYSSRPIYSGEYEALTPDEARKRYTFKDLGFIEEPVFEGLLLEDIIARFEEEKQLIKPKSARKTGKSLHHKKKAA